MSWVALTAVLAVYTVGLTGDADGSPALNRLMKIDLESGASDAFEWGHERAGEAVFVPAAGADSNSDEGYLLTFTYDEASHGSDFAVIDASQLSKGPIARVKLPQRVPFGFHGSWVPEDA